MNIGEGGGYVTVDLGAIIAVAGNIVLLLLYWSLSRNVSQVDKSIEEAKRATSDCRSICKNDADNLAKRVHDVELAHMETAKSGELQTLIQAVTRLQEQVSALATQNAGLIAQIEQLRAMVPSPATKRRR